MRSAILALAVVLAHAGAATWISATRAADAGGRAQGAGESTGGDGDAELQATSGSRADVRLGRPREVRAPGGGWTLAWTAAVVPLAPTAPRPPLAIGAPVFAGDRLSPTDVPPSARTCRGPPSSPIG